MSRTLSPHPRVRCPMAVPLPSASHNLKAAPRPGRCWCREGRQPPSGGGGEPGVGGSPGRKVGGRWPVTRLAEKLTWGQGHQGAGFEVLQSSPAVNGAVTRVSSFVEKD